MRVTTLFLALSTLPALAQTAATAPAKARHLLLEETVIHSGTASQFEPAHRDYCAAVVKGGAPACLVFSTATFGQSDRYLTLLPFASFIHYDQGKYTDKGLTPEEAKALSARRVPPIASNHESAIALQIELSILPKVSNTDYPINLFTEYHLKPGCNAAFLSYVKRVLLPAAQKAGLLEFEVFTTTVGESPDRVLIATRLKNFAELDSATLAVGDDHELTNVVDHIETYIMRYRADMSADPRHPPTK